MGLKYCCYDQQSGSYIEFQKGDFNLHGCFWLSDSLFLSDDIANSCNLADLFSQAIPSFNYYGSTVVSSDQWNTIKELGGNFSPVVQEILAEIDEWAYNCFLSEKCFSILGI